MDDAIRPISERTSSRRAILVGALGGIGAWAAGALGRAAPVAAADGDIVNVGDNLTGSKTTVFNMTTGGYSALWGNSTPSSGGGVGVRGDSAGDHPSAAAGVLGLAPKGVGVSGSGATGVRGQGSSTGVYGNGSTAGVSGASSTGFGVIGNSHNGSGVHGVSVYRAGVYGESEKHASLVGRQSHGGTAVMGSSAADELPLPGPKPKTGVYGESKIDTASRGVWGVSATGAGVRGEATSGIAVEGQASSAGGYAFRGSGRVRFDKVCGVASLAAGTTSKIITPGTDVTADSFVLLTPGADIGSRRLWFTKDTSANTVTIRLSSGRTSATAISWLLLR